MAESKTKPTQASVEQYLAERASPQQLADCQALMALMARITVEQPQMWGPSMVGYGRYRYRSQSGASGEWFATGFAVRGRELVLYLVAEGATQARLLERLGKHKMGKYCLYIKRLSDLDQTVLQALLAESVAEFLRRQSV